MLFEEIDLTEEEFSEIAQQVTSHILQEYGTSTDCYQAIVAGVVQALEVICKEETGQEVSLGEVYDYVLCIMDHYIDDVLHGTNN